MSYKAPKKAIITDAGFASRYLPITKTIPKAMVPIGAKPVMQLCIDECVAAGIEEIIIVATPNSKAKEIYDNYFHNEAKNIEALLTKQGKAKRFEPVKEILNFPKITVIEQDANLPYGNGSPIASAKSFINDDEAFVVLYSDDLVFGTPAVKELLEAFEKHPDATAIIAGQMVPHEEIKKYASIDYDKDTEILNGLVEKPAPEDAASDLASYGRYLLTPEVFKFLSPDHTGLDGELWTADAIASLIPTGHVYVRETTGTWMTTGDPKNYFLAHLKYVLENTDYADDVREFIKNN
ncbi:NTP transferase domain-containing protein [Candidatus Saccharibacteria bacterium]|nr:NTP transferase domain-containing protein [Candidatus Saccharibacteria bacterium]